MNSKKFFAFIMVMAMCCMMAFGQARDPKTGRFISTKKKPAASAAWNKAHPRDAHGRFVKKGTPPTPHMTKMTGHSMPMSHPMGHSMIHPMGHSMMGHSMGAHPMVHSMGHPMSHPMLHTMGHPVMKKPVAKKSILSKIKDALHKKKH